LPRRLSREPRRRQFQLSLDAVLGRNSRVTTTACRDELIPVCSLGFESLTPDFRRRIVEELTGIPEQVTRLIASLRSDALPGAV
jgi:hypothetical protein